MRYRRLQMRSVRAGIFVLVAALVALLSVSVLGRAQYFCRMMGHVVSECCCPAEHSRSATLRSADCCERIAPLDRTAVAVAHDPLATFHPLLALVAVLPMQERLPPVVRSCGLWPALARAPPAPKSPRFITHCALLI